MVCKKTIYTMFEYSDLLIDICNKIFDLIIDCDDEHRKLLECRCHVIIDNAINKLLKEVENNA